MPTSRVIVLQGTPRQEEVNDASEIIYPGMLIEQATETTVRKHATAAGNSAKIFAAENDEIGEDIDTPYQIGDRVKELHTSAGDKINGLLNSGANVVKGVTFLESAGDGTLRPVAANVATSQAQRSSIVAVADETLTVTINMTRCRVKIV